MNDVLMANTIYRLRNKLLKSPETSRSRNKRSLGVHSTFWRAGQTLRISFLGAPSPWLKQAIIQSACLWLDYAYLSFELVDDNDPRADIRIQTDGPESVNYSTLGNDALTVDGASMVLGVKTSDPLFQAIVLHEFGHALGMDHEHQHPDADIPWDLDALREVLAETLIEETDDQNDLQAAIEAELATQFLPEPANADQLILPYDRKSIMHYRVNQAHTLGNWETKQNLKISKKDQRFMRLVYPRPRQT